MPRRTEAPVAGRKLSLADVRVHEQAAAITKARDEARRLLDSLDTAVEVKQSLKTIVDALTEGRVRSRRKDSRRRRRSLSPAARKGAVGKG